MCVAILYLYIQNEVEMGSKNKQRRWSPSTVTKMYKYLFRTDKDIPDEEVKIIQRIGNCTAYDDALTWALSLKQYDLQLKPEMMTLKKK